MFLLHNARLNKKGRDILSLITLKLDNLAQLWILDNGTIAAKLLLKVLEYLVIAEFLLQPLDSGQAFPTITLLYTDMNIFL